MEMLEDRRLLATISGTAWNDDFVLLTAEQSPEKTVSIAQELAGVARIQAFMSSYKERLQPAGTEDVN